MIGCANNSVNNETDDQIVNVQESNNQTNQDQSNNQLEAFEKNGKWGFKNNNGEIIIKAIFDEVKPFSQGLAKIKINGVVGYINKDGNFKISNDITRENLKPKKIIKQYGYINDNNELAIRPVFDNAFYFSEGLAKITKNGRHGYINKSGEQIIEPQYEKAGKFSEGLAPIAIDNQWGFINTTGAITIEPQYELVDEFSEGLAKFKMNNQYGFIDSNGTIVIEAKYSQAKNFSEGFAAVKKDNKWGYINPEGDIIIDCQFDEVSSFEDQHATVEAFGHKGVINHKGDLMVDEEKIIIPEKFGNKKWGYITEEDKQLAVWPTFDIAFEFNENIAKIGFLKNSVQEKQYTYGYINKTGKTIIEPVYDAVKLLDTVLIAVKKDEQWGLVNKNNMQLTNFIFDDIEKFSEDLFKVQRNNQWGLVNSEGTIVLEPQFDTIRPNSENYAAINKGNQWGFINTQGEIIIQPDYDYVSSFKDDQALIIQNQKFSYINSQNELIQELKEINDVNISELLTDKSLDEQIALIQLLVPLFDTPTAEQMVNELISTLKSEKKTYAIYSRDFRPLNLIMILSDALITGKEKTTNIFTEGSGIYGMEQEVFLKYINNEEIKSAVKNTFDHYYGFDMIEGVITEGIDYKHIKDDYGDYLSAGANDYLELMYEQKDYPMVGDAASIPADKIADRLIAYEKFMKNYGNTKYTEDIKALYLNGIRVITDPPINSSSLMTSDFQSTDQSRDTLNFRPTKELKNTLEDLSNNEQLQVTPIAANQMLKFIASRENGVIRTRHNTDDIRENSEQIKLQVTKLLNEYYLNSD